MTTEVTTSQELPAEVEDEEAKDLVVVRPTDGRLITVFDDRFDVATLTAGTNEEIIESWCYAFRQAGEIVLGVSVKGVQAAVREMAKHGEVARLEDLKETFEDEREVRLVGTAVRYLVNADGVQIPVDRSIRALRQSKVQVVGDWKEINGRRERVGEHEVPDPKWYEKAYSKAVRNILLPLVRQDAVSVILNAFMETPKYQDVVNNVRAPRSTRGQNQQRAAAQPARQARASGPPVQQAQANASNAATELNKAVADWMKRLEYIKSASQEVYEETLNLIREAFPHTVNPQTNGISAGKFLPNDVEPLMALMEKQRIKVDGSPPPLEGDVVGPNEEDDGDPGPEFS